MKRLAGFALLFFVFASWAYAQDTKTNPYYPLKKGASWTFKTSQGEIVMKVTGTEKVGTATCWKVETTTNSKVAATELIEVRDDGLYRHSINGVKGETPFKFLKTPIAKGDSWDFEFKVQGQTIKGKNDVKVEDVTVPAGTYKGTLLVESKDVNAGSEKLGSKVWYADGVGPVKIEISVQGQVGLLELLKYDAGAN